MRFAAFLLALLGIPGTASAQMGVIIEGLTGCDFETGKLDASCIPVFIGHLVETIMMLVGAIFVINVMIGGYQYAIGVLQGDEGKGKDRIFWSIIGFITTVCAYLIIDLVLTVLGV